MGRAKARPAPLYAFYFQVCREPHRQPGPQGSRLPSGAAKPQDSRIAATRPSPDGSSTRQTTAGTALQPSAGRQRTHRQAPGTHPARPCPQAGPVLSLAGRRACAPRRDDSAVAHPGGRLSGWLAGPSSRHACWRARVRQARPAQARQALIRESLGLQKSVPT